MEGFFRQPGKLPSPGAGDLAQCAAWDSNPAGETGGVAIPPGSPGGGQFPLLPVAAAQMVSFDKRQPVAVEQVADIDEKHPF